ncbi:LysR substrate-binding domain-containing protein [Chelativorans sp. AA-79]|uniref:LysR substrate-binding domain-containing protein n=1 Tax=Chelativorans sp. AA-79 TaxID=3028735 RepID=UPI0023F833E5|nr:LysR substrate-binding domain-containing protein [Chelativorans sp. AA-79]WEX10899.1 LysR substrate-binding domain-containing protein [Chelativorans sp. AA-79]
MHFRQLEAFRTVMTTGSTVRAAELMQVTQPAVSRSIAELEAAVGFALFDRVRGRLVPTPEGQLFFREVDSSFQGLDRLRAAAATIRDYGSGSIRVASLAALGAELVPNAIHAFLTRNPRIKVTLQVHPSSTVRNLVMDGQFDVGLAADEVDLSGLDSQLFGNFPAVCAIPAGHPLALLEVIRPADLRQHQLVGLAPEDRARNRIDEALRAEDLEPDYIVETPSSSTVCALALAGVGIGFVSPFTVHGFVERGLVVRPFAPRVSFRYYLLFRPDAQKARLVKEFVAALFEQRHKAALQR